MVTFLSPAWLAAVDAAARSNGDLAAATAGVSLVVEQCITAGPGGEVVFHVSFEHGLVSVTPGPAPVGAAPTVRFTQDHLTAVAIAEGSTSAQRAFMAGALHVGGDLRVLLDHQDVLGALQDVFEAVRASSDLGSEPTGDR